LTIAPFGKVAVSTALVSPVKDAMARYARSGDLSIDFLDHEMHKYVDR
jgi:hypothetical protein